MVQSNVLSSRLEGETRGSDGFRDGRGSWDFASEDTQYATHGLHTYVAAMVPSLARRLIETYVPRGGSVLDPFCGGGAVLVEAVRSGRQAAGRDVNDLAVLISSAKTTYLSESGIKEAMREVIRKAKVYDGPPLRFPANEFVEFWFKDYMLKPLTGLRLAVDELRDPQLNTLMRVVFSATVRSVSLTHRNEVRLRRLSDAEAAKFNPNVLGVFEKHANVAVERVSQLPFGAKADVDKQDIRYLPFGDGDFDAIICSPPYGDERNGVNYTQFAKNMLRWLGLSREEVAESKKSTLGWGKDVRTVPPSATLEQFLAQAAENPKAVAEATAFYGDYYLALRQMTRVVRERVIIVIGNRALDGKVLDNASITVDLMRSINVPLEVAHWRRLPTKRLPRMRQFGAAINQEAILVFHV